VSKAEFHQGLWAVARDGRKLAEEDLLDSKPADLEGHLRRGQKHASKLGEVLDVHCRALPLGIVEFLLLGHDLDFKMIGYKRVFLVSLDSSTIEEVSGPSDQQIDNIFQACKSPMKSEQTDY
jgi:hypothetical protein